MNRRAFLCAFALFNLSAFSMDMDVSTKPQIIEKSPEDLLKEKIHNKYFLYTDHEFTHTVDKLLQVSVNKLKNKINLLEDERRDLNEKDRFDEMEELDSIIKVYDEENDKLQSYLPKILKGDLMVPEELKNYLKAYAMRNEKAVTNNVCTTNTIGRPTDFNGGFSRTTYNAHRGLLVLSDHYREALFTPLFYSNGMYQNGFTYINKHSRHLSKETGYSHVIADAVVMICAALEGVEPPKRRRLAEFLLKTHGANHQDLKEIITTIPFVEALEIHAKDLNGEIKGEALKEALEEREIPNLLSFTMTNKDLQKFLFLMERSKYITKAKKEEHYFTKKQWEDFDDQDKEFQTALTDEFRKQKEITEQRAWENETLEHAAIIICLYADKEKDYYIQIKSSFGKIFGNLGFFLVPLNVFKTFKVLHLALKKNLKRQDNQELEFGFTPMHIRASYINSIWEPTDSPYFFLDNLFNQFNTEENVKRRGLVTDGSLLEEDKPLQGYCIKGNDSDFCF